MSDPIDRADLLITRVLDGEASVADWESLRTLAGDDPDIWARLADATQQRDALARAVEARVSFADEVELPAGGVDGPIEFATRVRAWSGWAAAACIAIVWATLAGLPMGATPPEASSTLSASIGPDAGPPSPDQALRTYLDAGARAGRVVEELPTLMVEASRGEDGAMEVFYVRQILERRRVQRFFEVGVDDAGEPVVTPASAASWSEESAI